MARVVVDVMLKPEILDPAGQAVSGALPRLGVTEVSSVRIGKRVEIEFAGEPDPEQARRIAGELLANPVIENYAVHVEGDARPAAEAAPDTPVDAVAGADPVEPNVPAAQVESPRPLPVDTPLVEAVPMGDEPSARAEGERKQ